MMVNTGETQVFKRQMPEILLGLFDGNIAGFDFFE
jgi:hypothetical protein